MSLSLNYVNFSLQCYLQDTYKDQDESTENDFIKLFLFFKLRLTPGWSIDLTKVCEHIKWSFINKVLIEVWLPYGIVHFIMS